MQKAADESSTLSYGVLNATTLKYNGFKDVSEKLKLSNSAVNFELGYKPSEHNNDERTVQVKHTSKYDTSSGRLDSTEAVKLGLPKMGPIRPWFTVSLMFLDLSSLTLSKYF